MAWSFTTSSDVSTSTSTTTAATTTDWRCCSLYVDTGYVSVIPWSPGEADGFSPQHRAYAHALSEFGPRWRWMAIIDVDEFLFASEHDHLPDTLHQYEDCPAVVVPWLMFGPSGHQDRPAGLVIESYTERAVFPAPPDRANSSSSGRVSVQPSHVAAVDGPHDFTLRSGFAGGWDENKVQFIRHHRNGLSPSANVLRLNHYYTRSAAEFARKLDKGTFRYSPEAAEWQRKKRTATAASIIAASVRDTSIQRFVPALRKRLCLEP